MLGIVPAAGAGSRIQPLAFSKELLPVGSRRDGGCERPRAVSEYLLERMIRADVTKICFVIAPGKSDILEYFGAKFGTVRLCYTVQAEPAGLCDAIFSALPLVQTSEPVVVGLPDTIWFPIEGLRVLPDNILSLLLFPVAQPQFFDAVIVADNSDRVREIQVKQEHPSSHWVWGAFKMPGAVLIDLYQLWQQRGRTDQYFGTLVNAYLAQGGQAMASRAGRAYVDVGTLDGYRAAMRLLLSESTAADAQPPPREAW
jgi:glucose-1-phosphate thymidylyltransferase